jgi:uncharacterized membrane protein YhaH (DUF805 family)
MGKNGLEVDTIKVALSQISNESIQDLTEKYKNIPKRRDPISILNILFSFNGRINRREYWLGILVLILPYLVIIAIVNNIHTNFFIVQLLIIELIFLWPNLALTIKRMHDCDNSARWLLAFFIPILGVLYSLFIGFENSFLKGTDGPNRFGLDPLQKNN